MPNKNDTKSRSDEHLLLSVCLIQRGAKTKRRQCLRPSACTCVLQLSSDWCVSRIRERKIYRADEYSADVQFEKPVLDDRLADRQTRDWALLCRFSSAAWPITFGVAAMGFSFSRCQAAQPLIRLPGRTLIHPAQCMARQTVRRLLCAREI